MSIPATAMTVIEMAKHSEIKTYNKVGDDDDTEDGEGFKRNKSGKPYLLQKRTGCVGIEEEAKLGISTRFCTGKGYGTSAEAVSETYRGRTSSECFITLSLGMVISDNNMNSNIYSTRK